MASTAERPVRHHGAQDLPHRAGPGLRRPLLFLLICGIIYNANGQLIGSSDTMGARLIPFSILLDGTTNLDRFFLPAVGSAARLAQAPRAEQLKFYYLTPRGGHLHSTYPVTVPVLVTPLYAPLVWARRRWTTEQVLAVAPIAEKLAASLFAALSVAAMYLLLASLGTPTTALLLTGVFAFATNTWTTSSQALWQHGPGVLFILLSLLFAQRRPHQLAWAGLFAGLAVACRPSNLLFLLALVAVVGAHRSLRAALQLALPALAVGALVGVYNLSVFGTPAGGYSRVDDAFAGSLPEGLAGLLVSPSRGLLIFSPVLLAGWVGLALLLRRRAALRCIVYPTAALFLASQLLFFGWWDAWWGGWSYGPRLLTEASAMLVVLSIPALERLGSQFGARLAFGLLLLWSVAVQAVGALAYRGRDWDATPVSVDEAPARLWDWRDTQIERTTRRFLSGDWHSGCPTLSAWLVHGCGAGENGKRPGMARPSR